MRRRPYASVVVFGVLLSSVVLFTGSSGAIAARAANSSDANAIAQAKPLVTKYFTLVQNKDDAGLEKFLSPAFVLQRADGTGAGKTEFLENLPTLQSFDLTDFAASRAGNVLAVRYLADATGIVNGKPYTPGPAPRLSVFARDGKRWRIVAHANFNPLNG